MIPCIEAVNLTKQYDGLLALNRINVKALSRQVTTIVGVNGAGKTTLLKILAGLEMPTKGIVIVDGREMDQRELRTYCTMVFQKSIMFGGTVYDNVAYGLRINQVPGHHIPERVMSALTLVNLDGFEKRKARKLSSGEQQRIALARALTLERGVLLVDEPTTNLDPANAMIIERTIKESAKSRAVVMSTHNLSQARRLSDLVIHTYKGQVVEEGDASRFFSHPKDERTKLFISGELQF